jgi:hypothetical protein
LPTPLSSASRFSQPPDGLLLPMPCGLVSCHWHLLGSPFRAFSLPGAVPPLDGLCPPVVPRPAPRFRKNATLGRSRLQGLTPLASPLPAARWLGQRRLVALLGLCPSRVTRSPRRKRCFPPFAPHILGRTPSKRRRPDFRGLPDEKHGWSPKRLPTLIGFSHLVKLAGG